MGVEALTPPETGLAEHGWRGETPLWLYIQLEAGARGDGSRLGPVGGRIVAEVLLALLDADPESYRALEPSWTPTLPAAGERFGLLDLLNARDGRAGAR
jgi:hypothetical protein